MTDPLSELLKRATGLAPTERAALARHPLAKLDEPDAGIEAAWRQEVECRIDTGNRNAEAPIDWSEARKRLGL